jgi:4-hydroxy-2-oxoheptanedioate aldolase
VRHYDSLDTSIQEPEDGGLLVVGDSCDGCDIERFGGPMNLDQVEHMVRAAESFNITPITRIPNHEESTILRFLDRGVQGIIVPHINTKEDAESVA